jgi:amidase
MVHPDVADAVRATGKLLESLGHHVEAARPKADVPLMMRAWTDIVGIGTALSIRSKIGDRPPRADEVEGVGRGAWAYAQTLHPTRYLQAVGEIHAFGRQMAGFFDAESAGGPDILLSATLAEPPAKVGRFNHDTTDYVAYRTGPEGIFAYSPFCAIFNASGQPAASLPLGWSQDGLPIGIHLAAAFGQDELLISLCAEVERAAPWAGKRAPMAD